MKERHNRQWKALIPAVVFSSLCYAGFMFSNSLYLNADNVGVAIVVDGYYGKNNFCQYIHPLLCLLIRLLTPLLPTADFFTLLTHIVIILQIGSLFLIFTEEIFSKHLRSWTVYDIWKVLTVGMAILLLTSGITIWNTNYTITTGAIVLFGIIICFVSEREKRKLSWILIGAETLCFGCMLRMESALLFLPFVALDVFVLFLSSRIKLDNSERDTPGEWPVNTRMCHANHAGQSQSRLLPIAVIIILIFISRTAFFSREPYRTAARYNAARTTCVDFPMRSWNSEIEDISERTFSKYDYVAATNWCFFDTDFFDSNMLERIATAGRKNKYELSVSGIRSVLNEMRFTLFHSSLYMVILILLSIVLAIRNILCSEVLRKAETLLAILGAYIIIMYFTFRGRAPMKVWEPVIFATDFNLLMATLDRSPTSWNVPAYDFVTRSLPDKIIPSSARTTHTALNQIVIVNHICSVIIFIILWFSTGQLIANGSYHDPQPVWLSRIPVENSIYDVTVSDTAGEDSLFIWPNWSAHLPQEAIITGRLPSREIVRHNIAMGDWVYGQPYFTDFLKDIDAENPAAALLNRPNTYIMDGQSSIVSPYLQEHKEKLLQMRSDEEPLEEGAYITALFEPVPEIGLINSTYPSRMKHIPKGDMAEK